MAAQYAPAWGAGVTAFRQLKQERGTTLNQTRDNKPRGRIRFGRDRQFAIELLEGADLSTFLHETGHFFLEVFGDIAQRDDAPQQVKDDYAKLLQWFGVDSREAIGVPHHEQLVRGFEA